MTKEERQHKIKVYEWENNWLDKIIENTHEGDKTNHSARIEKSKNDIRIFALKNNLRCKK